jgi:uroporphyrinogen decarboxylase
VRSRERVALALRHQKPDRPPFNFWMDRRLMAQYAARFGADYRVTHFGADIAESFPGFGWPSAPGEDLDGMLWHTTPLVQRLDEMLEPGFPWPDPASDAMYAPIRADRSRLPDTAIFVDIAGPFTVLHGIRLLQNLFFDLHDCPDVLAKVIARMSDIYAAVTERVVQLDIDAVYLMDDLCSNTGLIFSPRVARECVFSCYERPIQIAHAAGLPVLMHSDGAVMSILDDIVALGFDGVNPLQPHLNDLSQFVARYGARLALYGGLDSCSLIPDGTPEQIRRHVQEVYQVAGRSGGLIFSTHDLPLGIPEANVWAMVDAIEALGYVSAP